MTEQERYESEIDNAIAIKELDKVEYSDILVCSNTPTILKDIGLEDLPILFSRKHLYIAIKQKITKNIIKVCRLRNIFIVYLNF